MQDQFILFGQQHIFTFCSIIFISFLLPLSLNYNNNNGQIVSTKLVLGGLLIIHELIKPFYRYFLFGHELLLLFPIHICHLAAISMGVYLITNKKFFFEIAFFWGLSGNLLAMVTPDLKYHFPDPEYATFFFGHGLLVVAIIFACLCLKTSLNWFSVLRVFIISVLILPVIYLLNIVLRDYQQDANYWYLMIKPGSDTILTLFPAPPWHIPYLAILALIMFVMSYLTYLALMRLNKFKYL